jgi:hypothetical protein
MADDQNELDDRDQLDNPDEVDNLEELDELYLLRQQASTAFDDETEVYPARPTRPFRILGMTPVQTYIIALMLLLITCLLSTFCLLVTGRVVPPFLY